MSGFEVLKAERSSMKFSFIIPAKDEWAYLPETLRRLRASRERDGLDFDVIVVLADSAELALCADADIVICESPIGTRATIARARNLGAVQSRAPIAMHTDADVLIPDLSGFLATVMTQFQDPRVNALTARIEPREEESSRLDRVMHRLGNAIIRASQPLGPHFCRGECQVTRMSAFRDIGGYDERITVGEDWDLFKRLDRIGNVAFINDLKVMHSTRRFRQYGYGATFLLYLREAASLVFLRRSWLKEWEAVR
jgi:glycosyltransferase involved in cell wall biosynthesis